MTTNTDSIIAALIGVDASGRSINDSSDATVNAVLIAVQQDVYNRIASLRAELEIWAGGDKWLRRSCKVSKASMERDLVAIDATVKTFGTALRAAYGPDGAVGRGGDVYAAIRAVKADVKAATNG